jgi:hypothetical protein
MIKMQMANPDCIEVGPVDALLRHAMGRVGAAIKQDQTICCFQPESGGRPLGMRNRSARAKNDEFHQRQG